MPQNEKSENSSNSGMIRPPIVINFVQCHQK
jgi:hypothetical protein